MYFATSSYIDHVRILFEWFDRTSYGLVRELTMGYVMSLEEKSLRIADFNFRTNASIKSRRKGYLAMLGLHVVAGEDGNG